MVNRVLVAVALALSFAGPCAVEADAAVVRTRTVIRGGFRGAPRVKNVVVVNQTVALANPFRSTTVIVGR